MQSLTLILIVSVDRPTRVPRNGLLRVKVLRLYILYWQQPKRFLFGVPDILQMLFIRGIMPPGNFPPV
jgi:hypothetical protein